MQGYIKIKNIAIRNVRRNNMQCPICNGKRTNGRGDTCCRCDGSGEIDDPQDDILQQILEELIEIKKILKTTKPLNDNYKRAVKCSFCDYEMIFRLSIYPGQKGVIECEKCHKVVHLERVGDELVTYYTSK